ncbi:tetratricopeptide repeat protein 29-like [Centruroides sculpturatus]|uniref:tetratricopeptide repeat protein 29-like n=1 Tax=Centruroides sculpturatus TaxID=218467 RepID=UPI000C6EBA71|nr:tetratricopeptide repeat protein 29-like [Centruroides sculpturatus]
MKPDKFKISEKKNPLLIIAESHLKKLAKLERSEISSYYQTYGHRAAVDLLQKGFVSAHEELQSILLLNNELYGNDVPKYKSKVDLLNNTPDKLQILTNCLMQAEINHRKGHWGIKFEVLTKAANHFQNEQDYWLSEYLYSNCMKIVHKLEYNREVRSALIDYQLGIHAEFRDDLQAAQSYLEKAHDKAKGRSWSLEMLDRPLQELISLELYKICIALGQMREEENHEDAVKYYMKALEVANNARDKTKKAVSHQKLGNLFEKMKETEKSQKHFEMLAYLSKETKNNEQLCAAYQALARIYHGNGQWETAIKSLEHCLSVAKESNLVFTLISVHTTLSTIYMSLGEYSKAFSHISSAANLEIEDDNEKKVEQTQDKRSISFDLIRVIYGITKAHIFMDKFFAEILRNDKMTYIPKFDNIEIDSGDAKKSSVETYKSELNLEETIHNTTETNMAKHSSNESSSK